MLGSLLAGLAVVLGAFGAHTLKEKFKLEPSQLATFETGVRYHFYHAFAVLLCGVMMKIFNTADYKMPAYIFTLGILFFSGSLYLMATKTITGIGEAKWLGPITPLGGLCFIVAWALFLIQCKNKI